MMAKQQSNALISGGFHGQTMTCAAMKTTRITDMEIILGLGILDSAGHQPALQDSSVPWDSKRLHRRIIRGEDDRKVEQRPAY